ncbi:MAG TPA: hypothetical protein VL133_07205 [Devosia sp.]|nr:hypothetical protein [Devosia sp.]
MSAFDTGNRPDPAPGLPMLIGVSAPRPSLRRSDTTAAFVSQLLAARENLPSQRQRRRNTVEGALGAYSAGARISVKRMPQGYRTTVVA